MRMRFNCGSVEVRLRFGRGSAAVDREKPQTTARKNNAVGLRRLPVFSDR